MKEKQPKHLLNFCLKGKFAFQTKYQENTNNFCIKYELEL